MDRKLYHLYYKQNPIIVDCINHIEPHKFDPLVVIKQRKQANARKNILKNVVLNIIIEKRIEATKPKLKDLLNYGSDP